MNVRNVIVVSSRQAKPERVETEASTWAELKSILSEKNLFSDGMAASVGKTKVSLVLDEAALPAENFILYLTPTKVKAGCDLNFVTPEEFNEMSTKVKKTHLKELRSAANQADHEAFITALGNYSTKSGSALEELYPKLIAEFQTDSSIAATSSIPGLEERLAAIEVRLGLLNEYNADAFAAHYKDTMNSIEKQTKKRGISG